MIEHSQSRAEERLHLERFLRTSAEYFGLAPAKAADSDRMGARRDPGGPDCRPLAQSDGRRGPTRR